MPPARSPRPASGARTSDRRARTPRPLAHQTQAQVRAGHGPLGATYNLAQSARDVALELHAVVGVLDGPGARLQATDRAALGRVAVRLDRDAARLSLPPQGDRPVTLG